MRVVASLVDHVDSAGVPRAEFLREVALGARELADLGARIPRRRFHRMCAQAMSLTGDLAFGLHSMERMATDAISPLGEVVARAATLRDALEAIADLRRLLGDDASFVVEERGDAVLARVASLPSEALPVRRFVTEVALVGLFLTIRRFRSDAPIRAVSLEYAAPPYHAEYRRVFEGCARFGQAFSGLSFDRRRMDAAPAYPDPEAHRALCSVARARLARMHEGATHAARVQQALASQKPGGDLSMEAIARSLGVSARSLRRHLAAEGKPYADLVAKAQADAAKTLLREEQRTIKEAAAELGFASTTAFHRAFRRWAGCTPAQYRRGESTESADGSDPPPAEGVDLPDENAFQERVRSLPLGNVPRGFRVAGKTG